ncbi:MAG TPA: protease complex subunit PrcB family protein [Pyrinomonadaceae bacterium]|jgi:hypothetical protein
MLVALGVSIIYGKAEVSAQEPPDLKQAALECVAERHGLSVTDLQVAGGPAIGHYPLQNRTIFHFKVRDTRSRQIYGVALDADAREVDAENLQAAENAFHEVKYGKLDPKLAERLAEVADETHVTVSIWLKTPLDEDVEQPRRGRRRRRGELPATHNEIAALDRRADARLAAGVRSVVAPVIARLERMGYAPTTIDGSPIIHAVLPTAAIRAVAGWHDIERIYLSESIHAAGSLRPLPTHIRPDEMAGAVPFENLGQGNSFNAANTLDKPTILVFGNKGEAARFTELLNDKTNAKRIEEVDFTRNCVVVVVRGIRPSGGYGIQIQKVSRAPGVVKLRVKLTNPDPRRFVTQAITYPYHLIKIQRSKLSMPAGTKWAVHALSGELIAQTIYPQPSPAIEGATMKIR